MAKYQTFANGARQALHFASQEAQRFNHEYVGTEHILLGLIREGTDTATNILNNLGIDLRKLRLEVEKLVVPGPHSVVQGVLPQTPRAKKAIEFAIEEARKLDDGTDIGTEYLLLGLLRDEAGFATQVLLNFGLNLSIVRNEVRRRMGRPSTAHAAEGAFAPVSTDTDYNLRIREFPASMQAIVKEFDRQIEMLKSEIAGAVGKQEIVEASRLRKLVFKLEKLRADFVRQW